MAQLYSCRGQPDCLGLTSIDGRSWSIRANNGACPTNQCSAIHQRGSTSGLCKAQTPAVPAQAQLARGFTGILRTLQLAPFCSVHHVLAIIMLLIMDLATTTLQCRARHVTHVTNTFPQPPHCDSCPYSHPHHHTSTNTRVVTVGNSELTVKHSDNDISANSQHI